MKWTKYSVGVSVFVVLSSVCSNSFYAQTTKVVDEANKTQPEVSDLVELEAKSDAILKNYCSGCHGPDKQEGDLRFDELQLIEPVKRKILFEKIQDVISLGEMPPAEAKQPTNDEQKILSTWLNSQLTGQTAKALNEKLQRFEYGNVVNHDDLFNGKHSKLPGFTSDRRWIVSEFIFNDKMNRLLNYTPTRTIYGKTYDPNQLKISEVRGEPVVKNFLKDHKTFNEDGTVNVVIEIPAGISEKWEVSKTTGSLSREFYMGKPRTIDYEPYPINYGMIPRTVLPSRVGGDGDPLDVLVLGNSLMLSARYL